MVADAPNRKNRAGIRIMNDLSKTDDISLHLWLKFLKFTKVLLHLNPNHTTKFGFRQSPSGLTSFSCF